MILFNWGGVKFHTFPNGITPKLNVIVRMGFEFTNFESPDQHFRHQASGTLPKD